MTSGLPFDDYRDLLRRLPQPDAAAGEEARRRVARLSAQGVDLGTLGDLAIWLAGWRGQALAEVWRPLVALFAATHGVVARHGLSKRPAGWLQGQVEFCAAGGAAINQVCAANDLGLKVFDLALHMPVEDITADAAFDERGCAVTMAFGMEAIAGGADLVCLGSIGEEGTIAAAALLAATLGTTPENFLTGEDNTTRRRLDAARAALELHAGHLADPLEALRRLGGREIAAIAGAILAARMERVPVVLDGMVATAAAAVLKAVRVDALDHCRLGHVAAGEGHRRAAELLGLDPILDLRLGEGEGVGAALAAVMIRNAAGINAGMTVREDG